jgi:hypothetical protein
MNKRNPRPREAHDFYRTPSDCVRSLLSVEQFEGPIWEPACGDGAISRVLLADGHRVVSTDLIDRGYGEHGVDFLASTSLRAPTIVTNPPFLHADEFVHHAIRLGAVKTAMLLRLGFLSGEKRRLSLWEKIPISKVWIFSHRPTLWDGSDDKPDGGRGCIDYAWFVWDGRRPPEPPGWLGKASLPAGLQDAYVRADTAQQRLARALQGISL